MSLIKKFNGIKILSSQDFVTIFKKYDKDGNGQIEKSELDAFLKDICQEINGQISNIEQVKKIVLSKYDTNNDGKLNMDEMSKILPTEENFLVQFRKTVKVTSVDFMQIWYHYDKDKNGFLEEGEIDGFIHDFLKKSDVNVTPEKIAETRSDILESIDINEDGKISLGELLELLPVEENFLKKYENTANLSPQDFDEIFSKYDKDKSGYIEEQELMGLLMDTQKRDKTSLEMNELRKFMKDILSVADTNNDGRISRDELRILLCDQNSSDTS